MKFFIAHLATETNTFAAAPTGRGGFEEYGIFHGDASRRAPEGTGSFLRFLRDMIEADGHEVAESLCTLAQPAGRTVRQVYEALRDEILADLRAAMPVDAVQLLLHGAMAAEGYDDCEGDLAAHIRCIVGPEVVIGLELDLHCHFTERMRRSADAILAFKEYPHVDGEARGRELYRLLVDTAAARIRPVTAVFDCKMVGLWHTTREPMKSFVARMQAVEREPGLLSVSLGHGFPWGDVPEAGAKLWVITDGDAALAAEWAGRLGREFWDLRAAISPHTLGIDEALDQALALGEGPVVLADIADNPGGGAAGDSTFILRRLIERGIGNLVLGALWDLGAVQICKDAGVGAELDLRVGGKCGPASGLPVDLRVLVRGVVEDHSQSALDSRERLGTCVWVEAANGLHLLLSSIRTQTYGADAFTGMGIGLEDKSLIVVKSTQHFHAQFAPLARAVFYVSTPGALSLDFASIPYRRRSLDFWPRVEDPHARD
ncbi:M81 family metallopeptidase [Roseateles violae]|uniref:Microcystinase C n=1 Tax=Roseateles violae TaxID=3058042 RepID=A0ABT8DVF8_9BURK|nr:M81 family metallopeptidase [Pelomonas sp. PFR6]MDN3922133.1 M81 family metallopeptidase [Pelomonas sp. PFR6]